jgi:FkbM family methyltransferase
LQSARFLNPFAYVRFAAGSIRRWPALVRVARNWPVWIVRDLLRPLFRIPCWIHTRAGTRFYLGSDPIDDAVLRHVMRDAVSIYFPDGAQVPPDGLVLDVGAHHGIHATEILRRSPGARLIAIEPNPEARAYFERNLRANGMLDRVEYVQAGLSNRTGDGFLAFATDSWEHSTVPPMTEDGGVGLAVPLRSAVEVLDGRHPYLVKLNAEGAEFEVVPDLFEHGIRPEWIILMIHPDSGSTSALRDLVSKAGYEIEAADGRRDSTRLHCRLRQPADPVASE